MADLVRLSKRAARVYLPDFVLLFLILFLPV